MPAIAKTSDFKNCTFKKVVSFAFKKQWTLAQAISIIGKNFPTKIGTAKKVERLTRALNTYQSQYNNGRLTFQEMTIVKVPAPDKKVYLKGLESKRKEAAPKKPKAEKAEKAKTDKVAKGIKKFFTKPKPAKKATSPKKKSEPKNTEPEVIDLTD